MFPGHGGQLTTDRRAISCRQRAGAIGNPEISPVITAAKLKTRTVKDLANMAKKKKVPGWHSMRKGDLIKALVEHTGSEVGKRVNRSSDKETVAKARPGKAGSVAQRKDGSRKTVHGPHARHRLKQIKIKLAESKDLSFKSVADGNGCGKDRLVLMVRDPYWLHAYWELTRASIERAQAALGQHWHGARPVLRLSEVLRDGSTCSSRRVVRDVPIHGGVNNWYLDVQEPPKSYQVEIGYLASGGRFFSVIRSNTVSTPPVGSGNAFDENWAEVAKDFDRVYAMSGGYLGQDGNRELKEVFEERLRRPMGDPMTTRFGLGAVGGRGRDNDHALKFEVDTELIVHGVTDPDAHVTLRGEPVHLRSDGTFAVRFSLPDRRHVLPVVASSPDGAEQRTIVLAVDRNTKVMEPVFREPGE